MPPAPAPEPTMTLPPAASGEPTVTRVASVASGFSEEFRQLLRSRLILVHLLALAYLVILFVLSTVVAPPKDTSASAASWTIPWTLIVTFSESVIGTLVLSRWWAMPLRYLRLWELIFFGVHAACYAVYRLDFLAGIQEGAGNEATAYYSRSAGWPPCNSSSPSSWSTVC